jgi:hypothetical protein
MKLKCKKLALQNQGMLCHKSLIDKTFDRMEKREERLEKRDPGKKTR